MAQRKLCNALGVDFCGADKLKLAISEIVIKVCVKSLVFLAKTH